MADAPRGRVSLLPVLARAEAAAAEESFVEPPTRVGVGRDDRLVMTAADDTEAGRCWLASDTSVDLDSYA
jgi:hypothetical protein